MATNQNPTPGPQNPGKYKQVGPNYLKYGEVPGYKYYYPTDSYYIDSKAVNKSMGIKDPSLMQTIGPSLAVAGGTTLATEAGKAAIPGVKGLLGLGDTAAPTSAASTGASSSLGGLSAAEASNSILAGNTPSFGATASQPLTLGADTSLSGATGTSAAAPAGAESALGGAAPYLGAAGAAYGAKGVYDATQMKKKKSAAISGGLSGAGMGAGLAAAAPLLALGPMGWGAMGLMALGGGGLGAGLGATMAHESTDDKSKRRFGTMAGQEDAAFKAMADQGMQESVSDKDTWDIGQDPSKAPIDLMTRSYGVLNTMGPDWAKYSPEQRNQIVTEAVNQGLINSKQGDYIVDNPDALKAIASKFEIPKAPGVQSANDAANNLRWREAEAMKKKGKERRKGLLGM